MQPRSSSTLGMGQRGEVSVELAIAFPLLLLIVAGLAQFALWALAVTTAQAAAQEGARAARTLDGSVQAGHEAAERYLAPFAGRLTSPRVHVTRTAATTRVEISARAHLALFGLTVPVRAAAESPTERPDSLHPLHAQRSR